MVGWGRGWARGRGKLISGHVFVDITGNYVGRANEIIFYTLVSGCTVITQVRGGGGGGGALHSYCS